MTMVKFPKIKQFRNVIDEIRARAQFKGLGEDGMPIMDRAAVLPKVKFVGTVKMHGTNASVRKNLKGEIVPQSRNRTLKIDNDNAGFANYALTDVGEGYWQDMLVIDAEDVGLASRVEDPQLTVYGEWCGGNIQKGIALTGLDKMFVVFAVRLGTGDDTIWLGRKYIERFNHPEHQIYNCFMFETFTVEIDFETPSLIQNGLVDITEAVEKQCPVGAAFGASGIGEGVVWRPDPEIHPNMNEDRFWFKVKGAKHSDSKVKELVPIDPEKVKSISEFVNSVTTDHRLQKGIDYLEENGFEVSKQSTGHFLQWLRDDILEEEADVMDASNLDRKDVMKYINEQGKRWFFAYLEEV